eukprot:scaffold4321_cov33-Tisochrysis_lutea.AAC.2
MRAVHNGILLTDSSVDIQPTRNWQSRQAGSWAAARRHDDDIKDSPRKTTATSTTPSYVDSAGT